VVTGLARDDACGLFWHSDLPQSVCNVANTSSTLLRRQAIRAAGASILYLPPYSPDLNLIEQLFAKLKALLRKAAARTKDELWSAIGRLLTTVPPAECADYLSHCGYGAT
jgi:transposase